MEERLIELFQTAEGISREQAIALVAGIVDEEGDDFDAVATTLIDLYERSLRGEDLGADATLFASIRNETLTKIAELDEGAPRAQEVLRKEFDKLVEEEFGEVTLPEQVALDQIFRQMFRDFRSTGRTDFDVFFDEQFDVITADVQQGIAVTRGQEEAEALEQQRLARAQVLVQDQRIPETLKAQIIDDAVRQAEAEGLAGDVDDERFDEIVGGLLDNLLFASPTAALELEAEAAGEDPLVLSRARRFEQRAIETQDRDDRAFSSFLQEQLAAGVSSEALAGLNEEELRVAFRAEQARRGDEAAARATREASALERAQRVAGVPPTQPPAPGLFTLPRTGPGVPQTPSPFGQAAQQPFSFGDFLQQTVGSLETADEAARRRERRRRPARAQITIT